MQKTKIITTILVIALSLISCQSKHEKETTRQIMENEECLICGAPLEYLQAGDTMECEICHTREYSTVRCTEGHYVCDACHTAGVDSVVAICERETSKNPIEILEKMMRLPFCHMHGPEHHVLVGSALLTAYKNAGGEVDLHKGLIEMVRRGKQVPGGACGNWGACGAGISAGMFVSIITGATPMTKESWGLSNKMTSEALDRISATGGPRCCKRDSYNAILAAIDFVEAHFGIKMEKTDIQCSRSQNNNQCLGSECPFNPAHQAK